MSKSSKDEPSELSAAAQELDAELERFERFAEQVRTAPLNSQKAIERLAKLLQSVGELDDRLSAQVQRLVTAVGNARARQQAQAELIQARALEMQARTQKLQELMEEYAALGKSAAELNGLMQDVAATYQSQGQDAGGVKLTDVLERMGEWASRAETLGQRSEEEGFGDITRLADSLRQQVLAARNKAQLLQRSALPV